MTLGLAYIGRKRILGRRFLGQKKCRPLRSLCRDWRVLDSRGDPVFGEAWAFVWPCLIVHHIVCSMTKLSEQCYYWVQLSAWVHGEDLRLWGEDELTVPMYLQAEDVNFAYKGAGLEA
jgi:hypothetical protein